MATLTHATRKALGQPRPRNTYRPAWANQKHLSSRGHSMGNPGENAELLGLSILSALSIAGVHSAINPSLFTLMSFATKPEARERAMKGLWIGLGASTIASGAIWLVFGEWLPAIISEITAVGLFGAGVWAVNQKPSDAIPQIQEQGTDVGP